MTSSNHTGSQSDRELLSHDETMDLIKLAQQGDKEAQNILLERNIALIKSIVKKFLNRGHEYDDLFQIGSLGFVKAIHNYDQKFNVRFSTYAVPMIMGEIKRFLRDDGMIKVSRSLKETANKAMAAREHLRKKLHRDPTIGEIASAIQISPEDIVFAMESVRTPASIYEVVYEDDDSPILLIDKVAEKEDGDTGIIDKILLRELLSRLEPRERQLIILRYFQDKTQSETAKQLGVSQVQVSRLESKILKKMREAAK
ncbi:MAG: RNA polymerase sporulation sigma factor SigF [Clostridia bacterium]|jgi:RNA polymerase sporulation-specific sigma factor